MDILELSTHRSLVFESIERKLDTLYSATRSMKHAEEVREYVLVVLVLMREYLEIHGRNFLVQRNALSHSAWESIDRFIESTDISIMPDLGLKEDVIKRWTGHYIRRHFAWLFSKILKVHCILEKSDYKKEYDKQYFQVGSYYLLKPRKRRWGGRLVSGSSWIGTQIVKWSWESRARYDYDCMWCSEKIHKGELYEKEVIRLWDSLEILRSHRECPLDPNDPRGRKEEEEEWENIVELRKAA